MTKQYDPALVQELVIAQQNKLKAAWEQDDAQAMYVTIEELNDIMLSVGVPRGKRVYEF